MRMNIELRLLKVLSLSMTAKKFVTGLARSGLAPYYIAKVMDTSLVIA